MSITTDLRNYADTAVAQGKHLVEQAVGAVSTNAQPLINDVTGNANELVGKTKQIAGKASVAVGDLRVQAEKAINIDAIKTAVEPYVAQVKGYGHQVTDRAEGVLGIVRSDARVAKLVDAAEAAVGVVNARVVKPVQSLSGLGTKPAPKAAAAPATPKPAAKPAAAASSKPATTKATATKASATKETAAKTARKSPAKRATQS
jgi:hypothetical protein